MREYRFRGKRFDTGDWIYGSLLDGDIIVTRGSVSVDEDYIGISEWVSVFPKTVGQYTGLKDKNGKEIYEGDVVRSTSNMDEYFDRVLWDNDDGCWKFDDGHCVVRWDDIDHKSVEVIGNIYENPELVGEQHA
jgi:phage uncharacterized protein TIGR01671